MRASQLSLVAPLIALLLALAACRTAPTPEAPPSGQDTLQQPGQMGASGAGPALSGVVRELNAGKLVLERMDGTSVTVTLDEETTIRQQAAASAADIAGGAQVTVLAEKRKGVPSATLVQIGGAAGLPLMSPGGAAAPGSAPASMPLGPGGPAGPQPEVYAGSVQELGADTITLQQDSGELRTIALTAETRYQREVSTDRGALQVGALVIAEGERDGTMFRAATLWVLSATERQQRAE